MDPENILALIIFITTISVTFIVLYQMDWDQLAELHREPMIWDILDY